MFISNESKTFIQKMCTYIIIKEMFDEILKLPELWGTTLSPNSSL